MGGIGSGRWRGESGRWTTDDLSTLDVRALKRAGLIAPAQEGVEGVAHLAWTPCNFGGSRPWFVCPGDDCGRRAAILYGAECWWLCRSCRDLAYASQREDRLARAIRRERKARARLAAPDEELVAKPKRMRDATFVRLGRAYIAAVKEHEVCYQEWMAKLSEQFARRRAVRAHKRR